MPRSFELVTESSATVEQVHGAFQRRDYWLARLATFAGVNTLESLVVDDDGAVKVATTQDLRDQALPGVLKALPANLKVFRTETWKPQGDRRVRGEVTVSAPGRLGSGTAQALIAPTPHGSRLTFAGTMAVKLPLVGGRIEQYIGGQLAEEIPALQQFTSQWIDENGGALT